jgi:hypothetical protein
VRRLDGALYFSRLCRLMCGKALPYRIVEMMKMEATPPTTRRSLETSVPSFSERRSLSAHQAAKPLFQIILNRNGASASTCVMAMAK